jgi:Zn-finger nucleic acid-binding protein
MREVDKDGVTIDICPQCKGVWLDRGELDKLLSGVKEVREEFNTWHQERYRDDDDDDDDDRHKHQRGYYPGNSTDPHYGKKQKKRSFLDSLGDLFE